MSENNTSVSQATIDKIKRMSEKHAVKELKTVLRAAVKLEMATIPIYLYTYYSICRKPGQDNPPTSEAIAQADKFPATNSLYGNEAGAAIMSVAVEEMLHMSLAMNLLTSMLDRDEDLPQIYDGLTFGNNGGIVLPALSTLAEDTGGTSQRPIEKVTGKPLEIPLAKLSLNQLQHFMRIEYPGKQNAQSPKRNDQQPDWATIGEVYDYAKALILYGGPNGEQLPDCVFEKASATQIGTDNYSASNIDTLSSGSNSFTFKNPPPVGAEGAASTVAEYQNDDNHDHEGKHALFDILSADDAITAINTICEQGEGSDYTQYVQDNELEQSHYYKFWSLCANLDGYPNKMHTPPQVAGITAPAASDYQISDLSERFVYDFPTNPKSNEYSDHARAVVDLANGLFQYMLVMSETTLLVPHPQQKLYFNKTMHQSMIWVMDKFYQDIRNLKDKGKMLVPTFENPFAAGTTRETAYAALKNLATVCKDKSASLANFSSISWLIDDIIALPDVSVFWNGNTGATPRTMPSYLVEPKVKAVKPTASKAGTGTTTDKVVKSGKYEGQPAFPQYPPTDKQLNAAAGDNNWVRHACMGINSCKNQGRTLDNNCAGQGWCSTALAYNPGQPSKPGVSDHQCHVTNDCKGQGGCGLYGTEEELSKPGGNACQAQGSCATPINAERFVAEGNKRGESVWKLARAHFNKSVWPSLDLPDEQRPEDGANSKNPELFKDGPTIEWIEDSGQGMTACGSSGMSGAGSCA